MGAKLTGVMARVMGIFIMLNDNPRVITFIMIRMPANAPTRCGAAADCQPGEPVMHLCSIQKKSRNGFLSDSGQLKKRGHCFLQIKRKETNNVKKLRSL